MGDGDGSGKTKATDWNVDRYINNAAFVSELGKTLLELLKPRQVDALTCIDTTVVLKLSVADHG